MLPDLPNQFSRSDMVETTIRKSVTRDNNETGTVGKSLDTEP